MINKIYKEDVLKVLKTVQDPELKRDLVSLKMVREIKISGNNIHVNILLTTPACPLREQIKRDVEDALTKIPGVGKIDVALTAPGEVNTREGKAVLPVKYCLAIGSGKGGVGKSTLAANISIALSQSGARVGLLDLDIYGPNLPTMLGVYQLPAPVNGKIVPADAFGIRLVSVGMLVESGQPLIWRGPMLHSVVRQLLLDVLWGDLDYLIIDLPPGTGDVQISLAQTIDITAGIIVTTPQKVSTEDASRCVQMFRTMFVPVMGIVENMSYLVLPDGTQMDIFGQGGGSELASANQIPFLGEIPLDGDIRAGGDQGIPILVSNPTSQSATAIRQVADVIANTIKNIH